MSKAVSLVSPTEALFTLESHSEKCTGAGERNGCEHQSSEMQGAQHPSNQRDSASCALQVMSVSSPALLSQHLCWNGVDLPSPSSHFTLPLDAVACGLDMLHCRIHSPLPCGSPSICV